MRLNQVTAIIIGLITSQSSAEKAKQIIWQPDSIQYSIQVDTTYLKIGKYIQLQQRLKKGASGWTQSKEDIPDSWEIDSMAFFGNELRLREIKRGWYYLSPENYGALSFAILNGGKKTNLDLEIIWNKLGKK